MLDETGILLPFESSPSNENMAVGQRESPRSSLPGWVGHFGTSG